MMEIQNRIYKELEDFKKMAKKDEPTVSAVVVGDNIRHWKGTIFGPKDTVYEGGTYIIDIEIPPDYPFKPPKV